MKIVIATDSLKGSLTSIEAGEAIAEGIRKNFPSDNIIVRPVADGGEGTVEALTSGMGGRLHKITVTGPLGKPTEAFYGLLQEEKTAIVEVASAAGITLIEKEEKNPLYTTTFGVGEIIRNAIENGCRHFIIGIGGSVTNDGGIGMLQALGYEVLNKSGQQVSYGACGLAEIDKIIETNAMPELKECRFRIACDVTNPLCGRNGASRIYGPQKGATPEMIEKMDEWLAHYADIVRESHPDADAARYGTGAAGGLGFAFSVFLNGELESGVKIVLDETELEKSIIDSDIVVSGEGRLDGQTVQGKAPIGVAHLAKKYKKTVIAFSGAVEETAVK